MARVTIGTTLVLVVTVLVAFAQGQAVLRAINGASKSLEWTSSTGGDLSFSHNGKTYLSFLSTNQNNADLAQGAIVGPAESEVTGSIRLRTNADGTSDIEGYVRGRWLSLSNDDPKNLFANAFEVTRISEASLAEKVTATVADRLFDVATAQVIPSASAAGVIDGTQAFAIATASERAAPRLATYSYKCDLLDCSRFTGVVGSVVVYGAPTATVTAATGEYYLLGVNAAGNTLQLVSRAFLPTTAGDAAFTSRTINVRDPANAAGATANNGLVGVVHNPVSIQIANTLHAVFHQPGGMSFYADATSPQQCAGILAVTPLPAVTLAFTAGVNEIAVTLPFPVGGTTGWVVGRNGYARPAAVAGAAALNSGNVLGVPAVAAWTPNAANTYIGGTYTIGTNGADTIVIDFVNLQYPGNINAFTGQIHLVRDGAADAIVRIEQTFAAPAPAPAPAITQGTNLGGITATRYSNVQPPAQPTGAVCFHTLLIRSYVYLTCPTSPFGTCEMLYFGIGANPSRRQTPNAAGSNSRIALHSLDADPASATRFVFSAINCPGACAVDGARALNIWTFTQAGAVFRPVATPVTIALGGSENGKNRGAVDFDAEISSTGTWMAVVGLQASSLEAFHWSYRMLSFATLPTAAFDIQTARILATSIDLDTTGESIPFGAAKIVRRGTVNYVSLLLGNTATLTPAGDRATAGAPILFRSADDTFASVYAAFPSSYHAINYGGVVVWPHISTDDVSVLTFPAYRSNIDAAISNTYPMLTRYTNGFLAPNGQGCNSTVAGKFYTLSSRVYACVETVTQDSIWTRSGIYTWAPVGTTGLRRQFARPNARTSCQ